MFEGSSGDLLGLGTSALVVARNSASFANTKLNHYYINFHEVYGKTILHVRQENRNFNKLEKRSWFYIYILKKNYDEGKIEISLSDFLCS